MVGTGNSADRALQQREVQDTLRAWLLGNNYSLFPTYLSHEGSQAVDKQVRLCVVHQNPLFQVCT